MNPERRTHRPALCAGPRPKGAAERVARPAQPAGAKPAPQARVAPATRASSPSIFDASSPASRWATRLRVVHGRAAPKARSATTSRSLKGAGSISERAPPPARGHQADAATTTRKSGRSSDVSGVASPASSGWACDGACRRLQLKPQLGAGCFAPRFRLSPVCVRGSCGFSWRG
jgi:hypothetical protein